MKRVLSYVLVFVIGAGLGFGSGYGTHLILSLVRGVSTSTTYEGVPKEGTVTTSTTMPSGTVPETAQVPKEPMTIPLRDLTDAQRAMLATFGIQGDSVTITPEMVECVYTALGEARTTEIVAGANPSATELFKVAPCLPKR